MNYLKVYCNLIRKAEQRSYTKKKAKELDLYVEGHHTFPISIFGKNKRIVYLTAREHYIAHALLEKICISRYGLYHNKTIKMNQAFCSMNAKNNKQVKYISKLYEFSKRRMSILKTGVKFSEERKNKISDALKGIKRTPRTKEHCEKISENLKGIKKSKIHRKKIAKALKKFWKNSEKNLSGKNNPFYGKFHNEKTKHLIRNKMCKYEYVFISPGGEKYKTISALQFCKENNLDNSAIYKVINKKQKSHKGWFAYKRIRG